MGLEEDSGSFFTSLVQVSIATLTFLMPCPQAHAWLIGPGKPSAAERSKRVSHWGIFKAAFHFLMGKRPSAPIRAPSSCLESPEPSATQGPKVCHCPGGVLAGLGTSAGTESRVSCVKVLWDRPVPSSKGRSNVLGLDLGLWVEGPCLGTAPVPSHRNSPFTHETVTEPTPPFMAGGIKANCGHPGDPFRSCDAEAGGSEWERPQCCSTQPPQPRTPELPFSRTMLPGLTQKKKPTTLSCANFPPSPRALGILQDLGLIRACIVRSMPKPQLS